MRKKVCLLGLVALVGCADAPLEARVVSMNREGITLEIQGPAGASVRVDDFGRDLATIGDDGSARVVLPLDNLRKSSTRLRVFAGSHSLLSYSEERVRVELPLSKRLALAMPPDDSESWAAWSGGTEDDHLAFVFAGDLGAHHVSYEKDTLTFQGPPGTTFVLEGHKAQATADGFASFPKATGLLTRGWDYAAAEQEGFTYPLVLEARTPGRSPRRYELTVTPGSYLMDDLLLEPLYRVERGESLGPDPDPGSFVVLHYRRWKNDGKPRAALEERRGVLGTPASIDVVVVERELPVRKGKVCVKGLEHHIKGVSYALLDTRTAKTIAHRKFRGDGSCPILYFKGEPTTSLPDNERIDAWLKKNLKKAEFRKPS